jgi:hypothetical protein
VGIGGSGKLREMLESGDKGGAAGGCCWCAEDGEDRVNDNMFLRPSRNRLGWRLLVGDNSSVLLFSSLVVGVSSVADNTFGLESVLINIDTSSLSFSRSRSLPLLLRFSPSFSFLPLALLLRSLTLFFDTSVNGTWLKSSASQTAENAP